VNAIIIYYTKTGNTEKVVLVIKESLREGGAEVSVYKVQDVVDVDFYVHDLACIGFPSYQWHPPEPINKFLRKKLREYRKRGCIKWRAPTLPGKNALIFCTYSGPHTGIREVKPAGLYAGQFCEHLGFNVLDEWYCQKGSCDKQVAKKTIAL
jgi:flavodoxin